MPKLTKVLMLENEILLSQPGYGLRVVKKRDLRGVGEAWHQAVSLHGEKGPIGGYEEELVQFTLSVLVANGRGRAPARTAHRYTLGTSLLTFGDYLNLDFAALPPEERPPLALAENWRESMKKEGEAKATSFVYRPGNDRYYWLLLSKCQSVVHPESGQVLATCTAKGAVRTDLHLLPNLYRRYALEMQEK